MIECRKLRARAVEAVTQQARPRTIGRAHAVGLGGASFYAAGASYVVLLVAARRLDPADNAVFLVFWAVLFGGFGVVTGVNPEAARAAHQSLHQMQRGADGSVTVRTTGGRIIPLALGYGAVVAAVIAGTGLIWGRLVLPDHGELVIVAAISCFAYSGHLALWGLLSGRQRWRAVAALQAGEATVRLVAVALAIFFSGRLVALAVASSISSAGWLITAVLSRVRAHLWRRADVGPRKLMINYARSSGASAASASLTVGFPVLIALTSSRVELLDAAGLLLAISLTRAPLLVPLTAFQGVALTHFLQHQTKGARALVPIVASIMIAAGLAACAAWGIGPWLYRLLIGPRYAVTGRLLAGLVIDAGLLAVLTVAGMCCLALHKHGTYLTGWVAAAVFSAAVLLLPFELSTRVVLSLGFGPLVGLIVQLTALARRTRSLPRQ